VTKRQLGDLPQSLPLPLPALTATDAAAAAGCFCCWYSAEAVRCLSCRVWLDAASQRKKNVNVNRKESQRTIKQITTTLPLKHPPPITRVSEKKDNRFKNTMEKP